MQWIPKPIPETELVDALEQSLGVPQLIAKLLVQRNITSFETAKDFFRPSLSALHDPFLMKDMELAIKRIQKAITAQERIMIYGDYDVDGTTSVALLFSYLKTYLDEILCYIPDRYTEGYGISQKGIDTAKEKKISLIIALDCGIKAVKWVDYATDLGIDFIICDHHTPGAHLPAAVAVLDPKRSDCSYPFDELCGCGIGFKLIQALQHHFGQPLEALTPFLDLVATAIAADIVPMIGENRHLTYFGLEQLRMHPRPGFQFFLKTLKRQLSVSDLVFIIAPRINAAGRMDHGLNAVSLLTATTLEEALPIARSIEFFNTERRSTDERITEEALQQIVLQEAENKATTVVYHPAWHKGVVGIVASRLIEKYYRPTVVLTASGDVLAGSVRSVSGFNVYDALVGCEASLLQFGGHKYAAGLTLEPEQLEAFKSAFEAQVKATITPEQQIPSQRYDLEILFSEISPKIFRIMHQMEPFGPQNMRPVFVTRNCKDSGGTRLVGKDQNHLKLEMVDTDGVVFSGIGFGLGEKLLRIKGQEFFDVLYTLEENEFNGTVSLQLKVKDIVFKSDQTS